MYFCSAKLDENQSRSNNLPKSLTLTERVVLLIFNPFGKPDMAKKLDYKYCKAAPMLKWIGNKWALVVLVKNSESEPVRFNELYRNIPAVSKKVLSQVLKRLTTDGIIKRQLYPDIPPSRSSSD